MDILEHLKQQGIDVGGAVKKGEGCYTLGSLNKESLSREVAKEYSKAVH